MLDYACLMLDAASKTQKPKIAEVCLRKTISASYYAVFHAARAYRVRVKTSRGQTDRDDLYGITHKPLWEWVEDDGVKQNILIRCDTLRYRRNEADYQIQDPLRQDAADSLEMAKVLVQEFEAMQP
jgi:uncharacterized protein (UPF0332 family)